MSQDSAIKPTSKLRRSRLLGCGLVLIAFSAVIAAGSYYLYLKRHLERRPPTVVTIEQLEVTGDQIRITLRWRSRLAFRVGETSSEFDGMSSITTIYGPAEDDVPILIRLLPFKDSLYLSEGKQTFRFLIDPAKPVQWYVQTGDQFELRGPREFELCSYTSANPLQKNSKAVLCGW